jgi:hypothetical protein
MKPWLVMTNLAGEESLGGPVLSRETREVGLVLWRGVEGQERPREREGERGSASRCVSRAGASVSVVSVGIGQVVRGDPRAFLFSSRLRS